MRWESSEFLFFQVAKNNDHGILHGLYWHILLQTWSNLSNHTVSDVNFLAVELGTIRVLPDFYNFANTNIHLFDIRHDRRGSSLGLGLLLLLLFWFLIWSFFGFLSIGVDTSGSCGRSRSRGRRSFSTLSLLFFLLFASLSSFTFCLFASFCVFESLHLSQLF